MRPEAIGFEGGFALPGRRGKNPMKRHRFFLVGLSCFILALIISPWSEGITLADSSQSSSSPYRFTKKAIQNILQSYLTENLPEMRDKIKIKDIRIYPPKEFTLPQGKLSYQIFPLPGNKFRGHSYFNIYFTVDGNLEKKIKVMASIIIKEKVVVTCKPLGRRQIITANDIMLKEMDLAKLPANVIVEADQVIGKRTKVIIDPYTPLTENLIETPPVIRRRKLVKIVVENDLLRITTLGQAQQDGRKGEIIRVRNLSSKKDIYARVVDANTVMIDIY
jgi:flagella basal body P-ring formation protein FlgA